MRKQDYNTLARIIREQIGIAKACGALQKNNPAHQAACIEARKTAESIGARCAALLNVDREAFVKACGIE